MGVEVVRRLVEQRDVGALQPDGGEPDQHRLTAGERGERSTEQRGVAREAQRRELPERLRLDPPAITDRVEPVRRDVAGLDRIDRIERIGDAERIRHRAGPERELLGQRRDGAVDDDVARRRGERAGDEPQERGLAGAVAADEAGAAVAERAGDAVVTAEDRRAVGPVERDARERDERVCQERSSESG